MKTTVGNIISARVNGVAIVTMEKWRAHPKYGKKMKRTIRLAAQNEMGAKVGDVVRLAQVAPLSKTIQHKVSVVIKK